MSSTSTAAGLVTSTIPITGEPASSIAAPVAIQMTVDEPPMATQSRYELRARPRTRLPSNTVPPRSRTTRLVIASSSDSSRLRRRRSRTRTRSGNETCGANRPSLEPKNESKGTDMHSLPTHYRKKWQEVYMKVVSRITDLLEEREVEKILFVEAGDREKVRAGDGDVVVTVCD